MSYKLWITYDEWSSGGGICEGQENDSWPDYKDTNIGFSLTNVYLDRPDKVFAHGLMNDEVDGDFERGDDAYVVIVRYGDGDTFSHSNGYWKIIKVCKDPEKANEIVKSIENDTWKDGYSVWKGYFNSLESVDIHYHKVL